jgi:hypothetical protein
LVLADWQHTTRRLADTEARMITVLNELGLTELVTSIAGLTPVGAATILAGILTRFRSPRSVVKHTGLCPRDNSSGQHQGKSVISGRGRPALRLAAWRAVWAAVPNNPVLAAKFTYLTTRDHNRLARQQARTACAAAVLRWLHVVVTQRVTWSPLIAAGAQPTQPRRVAPARDEPRPGRGEPTVPRGPHLAHEHGQPRSSPHRTRLRAVGQNPVVS